MKCPYDLDRKICMMAKTGISCRVCLQYGYNEIATEHETVTKEVLYYWKWFRKWFQAHVDEKELYMCDGTIKAWGIIKACNDALLGLSEISQEYEEELSVYKINLLRELYNKLDLDSSEEDKGTIKH